MQALLCSFLPALPATHQGTAAAWVSSPPAAWPNRGGLSHGGEELDEEQTLQKGMLSQERGLVLAPGIHRYLHCSSTKCFRAVQPRSIFTRYLRSINVSATASHRDLLLSAWGGDGFISGLRNELFQGVLRSLFTGRQKDGTVPMAGRSCQHFPVANTPVPQLSDRNLPMPRTAGSASQQSSTKLWLGPIWL